LLVVPRPRTVILKEDLSSLLLAAMPMMCKSPSSTDSRNLHLQGHVLLGRSW
jgi:hypothetical protein